MSKICLHATAVSLNGTAVLIRGPSGSGKSSLALQLLETQGTGLKQHQISATLISDDQTELVARNGRVFASPPSAIEGLMEIRGQGILELAFVRDVPVVMVVDLVPATGIERMPETYALMTEIHDIELARIAIDPTQPSAASRLRVAWAQCKKPL